MFVAYSSVCDTRPDLYASYLELVREVTDLFRNGSIDSVRLERLADSSDVVRFGHGCGSWSFDCKGSNGQRGSERVGDDGQKGVGDVGVGSGDLLDKEREGRELVDDSSGVFSVSGGHNSSDGSGLRSSQGQVDDQRSGSSTEVVRGRHWRRNRVKREKAKVARSAASVVTVDTKTGAEIEAVRTLAARRVVENKLAIARGEAQLRSYANKDKTEALEKLDAARMEQRINEAKAKSQASYKKCDESMKSLGSTGSAGEFALKQEIKKSRDNKTILDYVQAQADLMALHATSEVLSMVMAIPPPVLENEFDVFGDCPESYTEDQRESYFLGLARQQEENDMRTGIPC